MLLRGTLPFLSLRLVEGWGTTILHTTIDDLESTTCAWLLLYVALTRGPRTPVGVRWKSVLEEGGLDLKASLLSKCSPDIKMADAQLIVKSWKSFQVA